MLILCLSFLLICLLLGALAIHKAETLNDEKCQQELQILKLESKVEDLKQLAYYDILTGLPNRLYFNENIGNLEIRNDKIAFLLIDIDDFKLINDTHGHQAGDYLLSQIANRLNNVITDQCKELMQCSSFCCRLGGDEFVLVIEHIKQNEHVNNIAEKIFQEFSHPFEINDELFGISLSIGISIFPLDGITPTFLLKSADLALYAAKDKGKNQYCFHEPTMNTKYNQSIIYESHIRNIIHNRDLLLHYQPIMDLQTNIISGIEVLFRGNLSHATAGIENELLINVAENTGLIIPLGKLIIETALIETKELLQISPRLKISINLSVFQLEHGNIHDTIQNCLTKTEFPSSNLVLEITESAIMENPIETIKTLSNLKTYGIGISIDDFGKGFSSMTHLSQLPADILKLDKGLIDDLQQSKKSVEIVKTISTLGKTLKLKTCAEGIESHQQFNIVKSCGITHGQGYYIGVPAPIDTILNKLKRNNYER